MTNKNITLTKTENDDLNAFFEFQLDKEANMKTIKVNDVIAGSIAKFVMENEAEITYWIDRKFWGQGIATTALKDFLDIEKIRPGYARVAFDNYGSQKILREMRFCKNRKG